MKLVKKDLGKLKGKMPAKEAPEEKDPMFEDADSDSDSEPEAGESPEHEAAESPEFEAGEHEEAGESEESGLPEGTPEEEAMETEEKHTSELSDAALLKEVMKRGLDKKLSKGAGKKVAEVSPDAEEDTGY